jgi:hypothetical protein
MGLLPLGQVVPLARVQGQASKVRSGPTYSAQVYFLQPEVSGSASTKGCLLGTTFAGRRSSRSAPPPPEGRGTAPCRALAGRLGLLYLTEVWLW